MSIAIKRMTRVVEGLREQRKLETRARLLAAGRQLFGDEGLYDSRIEDLTAVAGIAKGTIYGYFEDKEALVHAVVSEAFTDLLAHVSGAMGDMDDSRDRVERAARAHFEFFEENPDLMRILHQVRGVLKFDRPQWRRLRLDLEHYLVQLAGVLRGSGSADARPASLQLERARLLFGAVSGLLSVRGALRLDLGGAAFTASGARGVAALVDAATRPGTSGRPTRRAPRRARGSVAPARAISPRRSGR